MRFCSPARSSIISRKLVSTQSTLSGSCTKTIVELSSDQENNFPSLVLMLPLTLQTDRRKKCLESARISDAKMCIIRIHPQCKRHFLTSSQKRHLIVTPLFPYCFRPSQLIAPGFFPFPGKSLYRGNFRRALSPPHVHLSLAHLPRSPCHSCL